jgi:hypothetical protein
MNRWIIVVTAFILAAVITGGCLGIKAPPVTRAEAPAILVDYQKTGGLADLNNRLVIFTNGAGLIYGKNINREISFNQTELNRINGIFSSARFSQLEPSYTSRRGGPDLIKYTISYKNMTVVTEDTAIPQQLQPVIDELNLMMDNNLMQEQGVRIMGNFTG